MSFVTYSGLRLIPAPFVSFRKRTQTTGDAEKIGELYEISIAGTILAYKGSPMSGGKFHTGTNYPPDENIPSNQRLEVLFNKRAAIDKLFSDDGMELKWQSANMGQPVYCYPRIRDIEFQEDIWFDTIDYRIECDADIIYGLPSLTENRFNQYVESADESWNIEEGQIPNTYNVRHAISAVGKRFYNSGALQLQPIESAKMYVESRLGFSTGIFYNSILGNTGLSVADFQNLTPYNVNRTESTDILGGTYNVEEVWLLASGLASEEYNIRVVNNNDDSQKYTTITIDGTIRGHNTLMFDYDTSYENALTYFSGVKDQLQTRMLQVGSGNYINSNISYDPQRGTINYSFEYDTRPSVSGASEEYTVSQQFEFTDYRSIVSVNGRIVGMLFPNETDESLKYERAYDRWNSVVNELYDRALIYSTGIVGLRRSPIRRDVSHNPIGGSIQYTFEFNNRDPEAASDEYSVSQQYSIDQGFTTVNINGSIQGYDLNGSGQILSRYDNALSAMPSEIEIFNRAKEYASGVPIFNNIISKEITHAPTDGIITYQYEYTTLAPPLFEDALSEVISVTDDLQGDVYASIGIPGRANGPILQDMHTKTSRRRSVAIELVFPPYTGVSILGGYSSRPNLSTYLDDIKPTGTWVFVEPGSETWDWKLGRFAKQITWTYGD